MAVNINAAPRAILRGVDDKSGKTPVYVPEALPQHLPHLFSFAKRGPLVPQIAVGDGLTKLYGEETFNLRSKWATHQTLFAKTFSEAGNQILFQRIVSSNAKVSRFRLSLDVLPTTAAQYDRDEDGNVQYGPDNLPIFIDGDAPPVKVMSLAWILEPVPVSGAETLFGAGTSTTGLRSFGTPETPEFVTSTKYPIFDFEVADPGLWGDGAGIRFSAPNVNSDTPFDTRLVTEQKTTMYRMQVVERATVFSTAKAMETMFGELYVDFSLKTDAFNENTGQEIYLPLVYKKNYTSKQSVPAETGTFRKVHMYQSYIESILEDLYMHEHGELITDPEATGYGEYNGILGNGIGPDSEASVGLTPEEIDVIIGLDAKHTINLFTGVAWNGYVYEGIRMASANDLSGIGGVEMKSSVTHYAMGGNDGTISYGALNTLVSEQMDNYGEAVVKSNPGSAVDNADDVILDFLDTAKWPQSTIWDSGFHINTKKKLAIPMARRKDMYTVLSTQEVAPGVAQNRPSEDSSIAIILQTALRMYPESEYYGTKTCRGIVIGQSGELLNSTWQGLAPMTLDFAAKVANYMGASNGKWKEGKNFDVHPLNMVTMFDPTTVNANYKKDSVRNTDWANSLVWVQYFDRQSLFYPAVQTVYDDDTSILNSAINIMAVAEMEKVCERTWREMTGIQTMTPAQFCQRSDELIEKKTKGRFDGKFVIRPETKITEIDEINGFSWTTIINLYGNNMKSVGAYTLVTRRVEDYVQ